MERWWGWLHVRGCGRDCVCMKGCVWEDVGGTVCRQVCLCESMPMCMCACIHDGEGGCWV